MHIYARQNLESWFDTTTKTAPPTYHRFHLLTSARIIINWNIITLPQKATKSEDFEEINQVVLDGISDNMGSLIQSGNYGSTNTKYTSTMVYYAINFISEVYLRCT